MKKIVMITGVTSGLGLEFTKICLQNKKHVVIIGRQLKERLSEDLIKQSDHLIEVDLSKANSFSQKFKLPIYNEYNQIVLILNAATIDPISRIDSFILQEFQESFQVNFFANVEIITSLLKRIDLKFTELHIVLVSSGAIDKCIEGWSAYSISKSSMSGFLKHLASELPQIKVSFFEPGVFCSKIQDKIELSKGPGYRLQSLANPAEPAQVLFELILNDLN